MDKIRNIPYAQVKTYHINFATLPDLYYKYCIDYDFLHDILVNITAFNKPVLPPYTSTNEYVKFDIECPNNRDNHTISIIITRKDGAYTPIYDACGKPMYILSENYRINAVSAKDVICRLIRSNNTKMRTYMLYKLLSVISEEDLHKLIQANAGEIRISKDVYESLCDPCASKLSVKPDFAFECTDGVNVYIHKFLLCVYSPMMLDYFAEFGHHSPTYPKFPFDSAKVIRFVQSFYIQRVNVLADSDLFEIYDYLQIISTQTILERYARLLGYVEPTTTSSAV
ncbi:hypothetical protein F-VV10_0234 [Faustovirus]|nr:hypothetical protein F-VV10_0234 [Faustovirus]